MKSILHKPEGLVSLIERVPSERVMLSFQDERYSYSDVLILCDEVASKYPQLNGANIAVISGDRESLALFLPALENLADSLLLLPVGVGEQEAEFFNAAGTNYVVRLSHRAIEEVSEFKCDFGKERGHSSSFVLATSGTTGTPKLVSYSLSALTSSVKNDIERGKDFVWGLTYDLNRFAGLQVYFQSVTAGSTLVTEPSSSTTRAMCQMFVRDAVNALSGTPSFWRKLLMEPTHQNLLLKRITLGGEISNQSVLNALQNKYPDAEIVHIYASTEAGVGFVVKDKLEGFPESYLGDKAGLACTLKVKNGNLWIKSSSGCSNVLKGSLNIDDQGFMDTGDMVKVENGRVIFLGRDSGSINVGGNKVMPEKVEAIIERHPSVSMSRVFAKSNPVLGAIVACEVVLHSSVSHQDARDLKKSIVLFCREHLETFEVPALFKVVESISIGATGKKVRS